MGLQLTTRQTPGALDADLVIMNGETIYVGNIVIANSSAAGVLVELQNSSSVTKGWIYAPASSTVTIQFETLFDAGLKIISLGDASVLATVMHSAGGR